MSTDRDVTTRIVRSWLHEDANEDADRILNLVLDQIDTTPQRRANWLARRFPLMNNNLVRVALVAAVLAVAVVIGATLLQQPSVGPSPTPTPIPLPSASGPVAAGTYISQAPSSGFLGSITLTIPDGWSQTWALQKGDLTISFWTVANLSSDACHWESTVLDPPLGPTVEDLVTGLEQQAGHPPITSAPVAVGGYSGQRVELDWPAALDLSQCDQNGYQIFAESETGDSVRGNSVGYHSTLWILDVEGTRLVIDGTHILAASEAHRAEIQAIVDSMQIEPGP